MTANPLMFCRQRRCGLVHEHQPGLELQRSRHGHELSLATRQRSDEAVCRDGQAELCQQPGGLHGHPPAIEHPHTTDERYPKLTPEEDVGRDIQVVAQGKILVDDLDARSTSVERAVHVDGTAVELQLPGRRRIHAGQDLDERRLAGAVVTDETHGLGRADGEVHAPQRHDGSKVLGQPVELEERGHRRVPPRGQG